MAQNNEIGLVFVPEVPPQSDCRRWMIKLLKLTPLCLTLTSAVLITYDLAEASRDSNSFETCLPRTVGGILLLTIAAAGIIPWAVYPVSSSDNNWLVPQYLSHIFIDMIFYNYIGLSVAVSWIAVFPLIFMATCEHRPSDYTRGVYFGSLALIFVPFGLVGFLSMLCYVFSGHMKIQRIRRSMKRRREIRSEIFLKHVAAKDAGKLTQHLLKEYQPEDAKSYLCPIEVQYLGRTMQRRLVPSLAKRWGYTPPQLRDRLAAGHPIESQTSGSVAELCFSSANFKCHLCNSDIEILDSCTRVGPCEHKYHWGCFRSWASTSPKCYTCKSDLFNTVVRDYFVQMANPKLKQPPHNTSL